MITEATLVNRVENETENAFLPNSKHDYEPNEDVLLKAQTEEKARRMTERAKEKKKQQPINGNLSSIKIIPGQLHAQVDASEIVLINNNSGIYQRAGQLVRIVTEKTKPNGRKLKKIKDSEGKERDPIVRAEDALVITEADPIYLSEILGKLAVWTRFDERKKDYIVKDCPIIVPKTLIARKEWDLPVLTGIIQAPTLRPNGSILEIPGYDEETGLFFDPGHTNFPSIKSFPTYDDAITARDKLLKLISEFPFEKEEDKSVAISAILTGLVRKTLRTAPLHGFTAPIMGTGKSLLATVVSYMTTGHSPCMLSQAPDEAEEQKRLLSVLMEGDAIICYDNIERSFGSAALCSVLTEPMYKGRVLGMSGTRSVPTNALFMATGNNLTFIGDISTRAVLCRLDPECERPDERPFSIDLHKYIPEHRGELVQAALTILRAYVVASKPKQEIAQFGRFEEWSDLVRSAIIWIDMEDPCASRKEIESADPVRQELGNLLSAWYEVIGDDSLQIKNVVSRTKNLIENGKSEKAEILLECLKEFSGHKEINTRSLGEKLTQFKNRIENGYRIENPSTYQGAKLWRVKKTT